MGWPIQRIVLPGRQNTHFLKDSFSSSVFYASGSVYIDHVFLHLFQVSFIILTEDIGKQQVQNKSHLIT